MTLSLGVTALAAGADVESGSGAGQLSPFWGGAISQWSHWILYWAAERELDPDLVAAVVRQESLGQSSAEGPYGSVGLMMVLPAEVSGMPWRPTAEELKQPNVNVRWGTGILAEVIRETGGDLVRALAAYNGGWEQVHIRSTERYAHSVLTYYAHALAGRHGYGYQESKVWSMVIMTRVDGHIQHIQVRTSGHFLAPCFEGALEFRKVFPDMVDAPRARVAHFVDEEGHDVLVDAWLFVGEPDRPVDETLVSLAAPSPPRIVHQP
jgi:hypothetical protein